MPKPYSNEHVLDRSFHTEQLAWEALRIGARRNDTVSAKTLIECLGDPDCSKLWRRLLALAINELGPSDLGLLADLVELAGGKTSRRTTDRPPQQLLSIAIHNILACRPCSVCQRARVVTFEVAKPAKNSVYPDFVSEALRELEQLQTIIAPVRLASGRLVISAAGRRRLPDYWKEQGVDETLYNLSVQAVRRTDDLSATFLPWSVKARAHEVARIATNLPTTDTVRGFPSYAFTARTQLGVKALCLWLDNSLSLKKVLRWIKTPQRAIWLLGLFVERTEAEPRAREVQFDVLTALGEIASCDALCADMGLLAEGMEVARDQLELLNACRREVASNVR